MNKLDKFLQAKSDKPQQAKREKQQRLSKGGGTNKAYRNAHLGVTPRANMCCRRAHGQRESLVATFGTVVAIVPPMQATVVETRTIFRGAILLRCIHVLHGKCMLRVAYVKPGLKSIDLGQICRLTIRVKESGRCLGLKDASSKMSCHSRIGPAAPLVLLLTLYLFAAVRVRRRGFGSDGSTSSPPARLQIVDCMFTKHASLTGPT
jgi:hypothetical protein